MAHSRQQYDPNALACPKCNESNYLRANLMQDVDVRIDKHGRVTQGTETSLAELDESGEFYCSNCATHLRLNPTEAGKHDLVVDE